MAAAKRRGKQDIIDKCLDIMLTTLEFGWDKEHGGFFYFMDIGKAIPLKTTKAKLMMIMAMKKKMKMKMELTYTSSFFFSILLLFCESIQMASLLNN